MDPEGRANLARIILYFLLWLVGLGVVGGSFGRQAHDRESAHGRILDILMGFGGALVIGMWADPLGGLGLSGFAFASVSALLGATLLTVLTAFMNGRKYARGKNHTANFRIIGAIS